MSNSLKWLCFHVGMISFHLRMVRYFFLVQQQSPSVGIVDVVAVAVVDIAMVEVAGVAALEDDTAG